MSVDQKTVKRVARLARLNRDNRKLCDRLARIVGTYCPGLAKTPLHIHRYGASRPY